MRTFDGRAFCLSTSWTRSSIVALPALDLVIVTEKDEPLCRVAYIDRNFEPKTRILCLFFFDEEHYPPRMNSSPTGLPSKRMEKIFRTVSRIIGERERAVRTSCKCACAASNAFLYPNNFYTFSHTLPRDVRRSI